MSEAQSAETKEQAVARGFLAILRHVRRHGLTDEVAVVETWINHAGHPAIRGEMARLLAMFWNHRNDPDKAVLYGDLAGDLLPGSPDGPVQAIAALRRAGRWADLIPRARTALARYGETCAWHDALCDAHAHLGQWSEARRHGTRCLELLEATATAPALDLGGVAVPPFDATAPERNVISFWLRGDNEQHIRMAMLNARAARFLYLGWTCRFYLDDSVPAPVLQALAGEGARVLRVDGLPADPYGPFWRLLAADDPAVDRYLIRDVMALVNIRECVAVQEWLGADSHFHVMRDCLDQTRLVMPSLWGGVRGALPPARPWTPRTADAPSDLPAMPGETVEQAFLRERFWPTIRTSATTHDSQFSFGATRDFPAVGWLPPGRHVGGDGRALLHLKPNGATPC